jgi:mRNA-degrading endonuclease YafQ of YafQ-DinJ toxin-antitoxin module
MSYKISYFSAFKNDVKALKNNKKVSEDLQKVLLAIVDAPFDGALLVGAWAGFRKIGFGNNPQFRLIYSVSGCCVNDTDDTDGNVKECEYTDGNSTDCSGVIDFIAVKTRENCNNLYAKSKKYTDNFRR